MAIMEMVLSAVVLALLVSVGFVSVALYSSYMRSGLSKREALSRLLEDV